MAITMRRLFINFLKIRGVYCKHREEGNRLRRL